MWSIRIHSFGINSIGFGEFMRACVCARADFFYWFNAAHFFIAFNLSDYICNDANACKVIRGRHKRCECSTEIELKLSEGPFNSVNRTHVPTELNQQQILEREITIHIKIISINFYFCCTFLANVFPCIYSWRFFAWCIQKKSVCVACACVRVQKQQLKQQIK